MASWRMDFTVEQRFAAPADAVLALYADPDFHASLGAGERIGPPEVVHHERVRDEVRLEVRYRFTADLPAAARRVVEPDKLTWVERTRVDLVAMTARSTLVADHYASLLAAGARTTYRDEAATGERTAGSVRRIEGRLSVKVPLVGGKVERAIVDGLREHLALEGRVAAARLGG